MTRYDPPSYLSFAPEGDDSPQFTFAIEAYRAYLRSIRDSLPPGARAFASEPWWYDPSDDPRRLHDSWLDHIIVRESASEGSASPRSVSLEMLVRGPTHEMQTTLEYVDVIRYELDSHAHQLGKYRRSAHHGDWIADELRLGAEGTLVHEVWFAGPRFRIECADLRVSSKPAVLPTKGHSAKG